jgi:hypothetical protein
MAMSWEILSYTLTTTREPDGGWKRLMLQSAGNHYALLFFLPSAPPFLGTAYNIDQPNPYPTSAALYWPPDDFDATYDIVRSEKPLFVEYNYDPPGYHPDQPSRSLTNFAIHTGPEPTGEGPLDANAIAALTGAPSR